jgi:ATP-dependent DNA helicase RecG
LITREVSPEEALALVEREESHFFDKKAVGVSGKQVQKIAVALANADGGEFLIGVADEKDVAAVEKRWQGAANIEALNSHLQSLFDIQPNLDLRYEFLKCHGHGGYVLRVIIEKSSQVHKTGDQTVYVRYGAQSLPLKDPEKITELSFAKGASSFEDQLLLKFPPEQIVESRELQSFLADYSPKTDPLDFVLNQNLLDYKTWEPRVSSAYCFMRHPARSCHVNAP